MKARIEMLMMDLNKRANTTESHYSHEDKEEIAVIMKGSVCGIEGKEYYLEEGDVVRIPPNVKHRFLNKSDESNHILFVLTPSLG